MPPLLPIDIQDQALRRMVRRVWGADDNSDPDRLGVTEVTTDYLIILLIDRIQTLIDTIEAQP